MVHYSIYALLDDAMLAAFGFPRPLPLWRPVVSGALHLRGWPVRWLPARRTPNFVNVRRNRSWPRGYRIAELGPPRMVEGESGRGRGWTGDVLLIGLTPVAAVEAEERRCFRRPAAVHRLPMWTCSSTAKLDDPDTAIKRDGGGFNRPDEIFSGELPLVLVAISEAFGASIELRRSR